MASDTIALVGNADFATAESSHIFVYPRLLWRRKQEKAGANLEEQYQDYLKHT